MTPASSKVIALSTTSGGTRRQVVLLFALLAIGGILTAAYEAVAYVDAKADVASAANDLTACRSLAVRIERLKARPAIVGTSEVDYAELAGRIERAATAAGIAPASLVQITPAPSRRIGDTPYLEKPTAITLADVGVRPLATFLYTLTAAATPSAPDEGGTATGATMDAAAPRLILRDLRLSTPPGEQGTMARIAETWSADVTLVYQIYSPRGRGDNAGGNAE